MTIIIYKDKHFYLMKIVKFKTDNLPAQRQEFENLLSYISLLPPW